MEIRILILCLSTLVVTACGKNEFLGGSGGSTPASKASGGKNVDTNDETAQVLAELEANNGDINDDPNDPNDSVIDTYGCGKGKKMYICHVPPGNPANKHTLCLPPPAIRAHLAQHQANDGSGIKDTIGPCK